MKSKKPVEAQKIVDYAIENELRWDLNGVRVDEISDGNINYIYRIINKKTRESYILKLADNATRVNPDGYLSPDRNGHEASVLQYYRGAVAGRTPEVFAINKKKHFFLMEDIVPSTSLRELLMRGDEPSELGIFLANFIVDSTFPLLDIISGNSKKPCYPAYPKDLIKITEDLVFTFPYNDVRERNVYIEENKAFLKEKVCNNKKLQLTSALCCEKFKNYKQSLIHGDLHTGSVLVKYSKDENFLSNVKMYVVDPEFAFYGPIAYDVGNVLAHLHFAKIYRFFTEKNDQKRAYSSSYYNFQINSFMDTFYTRAMDTLKDKITNILYKTDAFITHYVNQIIDDSFVYAGLEIIRRITGSAKVAELESVTDMKIRAPMERSLVDTALDFIFKKQFN